MSWWISIVGGIALLLLAGCSDGTTDDNGAARRTATPSATYLPTSPRPREVGKRLIGPGVYTVDARSKEIWMYFDFSRGAVVAVQHPKTDAWDLAFRRHVIRLNGGATNPAAEGAILNLGERDFTSVTRVPAKAVFLSDVRTKRRPFPYNPVVAKWYNYSYVANVLTPKPVVYIVRTQDGKYAKMRLVSYYCDGNVSGCMTFEYVYQGNGSTNLTNPAARLSQHLKKP